MTVPDDAVADNAGIGKPQPLNRDASSAKVVSLDIILSSNLSVSRGYNPAVIVLNLLSVIGRSIGHDAPA